MEFSPEYLKDLSLIICFFPVAIALLAVFLKFINKIVCKFSVSYLRALKIEFLVCITFLVLDFLTSTLGFYFDCVLYAAIFSMILYFIIGTPFYAKMLVHPMKGPIGWGKGLVISLIFGVLDVIIQVFNPIAYMNIATLFH